MLTDVSNAHPAEAAVTTGNHPRGPQEPRHRRTRPRTRNGTMTDTTPQPDPDAPRRGRFLTLAEVAEELKFRENQIYALVRRGDL
ncbi:hypothetical protein BWI15_30960 [Kribbella sp. ALI-6-A]|nr:hypothetical protein BWI15_30960 [Kribbella sp. ALI-6-A]